MSQLDFKTLVRQEEDRLGRLHPTPNDVPGCFSLFDEYISCAVIRSQIKSVYRYGHRPECSPKFEEFKFCMSLKGLHPEEKREAWIKRRAEWWANKRINKSSEDVWVIREKPLEAFPRPLTDEMINGSPVE